MSAPRDSTREDQVHEDRHARLLQLNEARFRPSVVARLDAPRIDFGWENKLRLEEETFVEELRARVAPWLENLPSDPDAFGTWFAQLKDIGPGQHDPLFPWLAEAATRDDLCWFLIQEVGGEAGFEDLLALTQIKMPTAVKLEMARNFWDEMGQGNPRAMHGPLLERLVQEMDLDVGGTDVVWQSRALGNLMAALASNRHYAFQSVGALGVIELTAPGRAQLVNAGLKRLAVGPEARKYFALHATLDVQHFAAWDREVLRPLVAANPAVARSLAEGALMRLYAGSACFVRYRAELFRRRPAVLTGRA